MKNRTISGIKDFSATTQIRVGNNVGNPGSRQGNVKLASGANVTLTAPDIRIANGFSSNGATFKMEVKTCCS